VIHAEIQRRLCTASAHDRIVAAVAAASSASRPPPDQAAGQVAATVPEDAQLPVETLELLHHLLLPG